MNINMLNQKSSRISAIMALVLSVLAIFSSVLGVLDSQLYRDLLQTGVISEKLMVGSVAQDIISILMGIVLLVLSIVFLKYKGLHTFICVIGLAWYFFYAYGLYVMQGNYTSIYLVYLTIFGLSIYSMIWGLVSFNKSFIEKITLSRKLSISIAIFLGFILFILFPVWILKILPDISKHIPGETYGVYILDLCIVFPAFLQIAIMLLKKNRFANILAGIALIKTFTLCLSWGFGECYTPIILNTEINYGMASISGLLTITSLILLILYFHNLNSTILN